MGEREYQNLFEELTRYENRGIRIKLGNMPASPLQVVTAHMVREECNYMRDYEWDEAGHVKEITFYDIGGEKKQTGPSSDDEFENLYRMSKIVNDGQ